MMFANCEMPETHEGTTLLDMSLLGAVKFGSLKVDDNACQDKLTQQSSTRSSDVIELLIAEATSSNFSPDSPKIFLAVK